MDIKAILKNNISELTFGTNHSLIVGHRPSDVCAEGLCENILSAKTPESLMSFGLFGGSSADVNKFYPNNSPEDWKPKDEDFIEPVFRGISETIVSFMGTPIDFSKPGVLKKSMPLLKGVTINTNHDTETENAVGAVSNVVWQQSYKVGSIVIPSGINMVMKIDAKSNPRLARGILMDPPSIHSNSVTVRFKHEPSHPEDKNFWDKVGTRDSKGQLYRVIVTEILLYKETSLVNHGADPYAQRILDDGSIINPVKASKFYNFSEDPTLNHLFISNTENTMNFSELVTKLGLTEEAIPTEDALVAHFQSLADNQIPEGVDIASLQTDTETLRSLTAVVESLSAETLQGLVDNQLPEGAAILTEDQQTILDQVAAAGSFEELSNQAQLGAQVLKDTRDSAIAKFKAIHGEAANAAIITTIQSADLVAARAFEAQFEEELNKTLPLTCVKCGSTEVSRASANKPPKTATNSYEAARDEFAKKTRRTPSQLHGVDKA